MRARRAEITPGSLWSHVVLGSESIYKVLAVDGDHVDVAVRRGPGMQPGTRVRLTTHAIRAMVRVDDDERHPLRRLHSV